MPRLMRRQTAPDRSRPRRTPKTGLVPHDGGRAGYFLHDLTALHAAALSRSACLKGLSGYADWKGQRYERRHYPLDPLARRSFHHLHRAQRTGRTGSAGHLRQPAAGRPTLRSPRGCGALVGSDPPALGSHWLEPGSPGTSATRSRLTTAEPARRRLDGSRLSTTGHVDALCSHPDRHTREPGHRGGSLPRAAAFLQTDTRAAVTGRRSPEPSGADVPRRSCMAETAAQPLDHRSRRCRSIRGGVSRRDPRRPT